MNARATDSPFDPDRILVIGYGNELRGDDAAGRFLAQRIATWRLPGVRVLSVRQLTPELAAEVPGGALVLFADAIEAGDSETAPRIRPVTPSGESSRSHHCGPAEILSLAERLYGEVALGAVVSIPGEQFGWGRRLSPTAQTNLEEALILSRNLIDARQLAAQ